MPIKFSQRLRRALIPTSNAQASETPPAAYQGVPLNLGRTKAAVVGAVVETVKVPVAGATPLRVTGVVPLKLKVGRSTAPLGLVAIAAVRTTLPVKPFAGVTVMVVVLPVVAPGELMVMAPPLANEKVGGGMKAVTLTFTTVVCVIAPDVPVTVTA